MFIFKYLVILLTSEYESHAYYRNKGNQKMQRGQ